MRERVAKSGATDKRGRDPRTTRSLNLTMGGITLLGVILGIGTTVGFGLSGEWWLRLGAGAATIVLLVTVVKAASRSGRGVLARAANWVIGVPGDER